MNYSIEGKLPIKSMILDQELYRRSLFAGIGCPNMTKSSNKNVTCERSSDASITTPTLVEKTLQVLITVVALMTKVIASAQ